MEHPRNDDALLTFNGRGVLPPTGDRIGQFGNLVKGNTRPLPRIAVVLLPRIALSTANVQRQTKSIVRA
jgi:hypothetical protein